LLQSAKAQKWQHYTCVRLLRVPSIMPAGTGVKQKF